MKLSHTAAATSAVFDDPHLVSSAGLVPLLRLAGRCRLDEATGALTLPGDTGANPAAKITSLVAGMAAGGYAKQGAEHGYTHVKGLNAMVATVTTPTSAPVIAGTRLRRGAVTSRRTAPPEES